jgi:hypothetical protein
MHRKDMRWLQCLLYQCSAATIAQSSMKTDPTAQGAFGPQQDPHVASLTQERESLACHQNCVNESNLQNQGWCQKHAENGAVQQRDWPEYPHRDGGARICWGRNVTMSQPRLRVSSDFSPRTKKFGSNWSSMVQQRCNVLTSRTIHRDLPGLRGRMLLEGRWKCKCH